MSRGLPSHVFHLAEQTNFSSIRQYGLLSASALLDLAGVGSNERAHLERRCRLTHTELPNGVQIRDQKPLLPQSLTRCLVGMTPSEWYALVNSKVFFWLDPARLNRQRAACEPRPQVVLVLDTKRLVDRHGERMALSRINSGNARRRPAQRGRCTFVPYRVWVESGWLSEMEGLGMFRHRTSGSPVELTVTEGVPDIMRYVTAIHRLRPGQSFRPAETVVSVSQEGITGRGYPCLPLQE